MSCSHHAQVARHWSPSGPDLPDATALHLDACGVCRVIFEARFPPVHAAPLAMAPTRALQRWLSVAAAAALCLTLARGPAQRLELADAEPPNWGECFEEIQLPPECPV